MRLMMTSIGIDVSQSVLDVHSLQTGKSPTEESPTGESWRV